MASAKASTRGPTRPAYNPAEVIEGAQPARLGAVTRSVAAATLLLLVLGSRPLLEWTNNLPISAVSDQLLEAAQDWNDAMDAVGLDELFQQAQHLFRLIEALRF